MVDGWWRRSRVLLLLPVVAAFAGCTGGGNSGTAGATAGASAAAAAATGLSTAEKLRDALLTRVNGVTATAPAATGTYASLPEPGAKKTAGAVQVTPAGCTGSALAGFNPAALAGAMAASVSFRVSGNDVSEVLIASSDKSAAAALAGKVPAKCAHYEEKVDGKTFKYAVDETTLTGIGKQARVLNVDAEGAASEEQWSLVYRGTGFVGAVTVIGPNASADAVRELGQQAYAFAAKSLSYAKGHD
jgi:hypothetical protein